MVTEQRLAAQMAEHILEARHEAATEDFCQLLREGAAPLALGSQAIRTASPFLHVPAHVMLKPDGELRSVNYDHTILGMWRSVRMSRMMPKGYASLPYVQAMWYVPQGLDIWSQILCEFPGHYAREQEKCPAIQLKGPRQHFEEYPPITSGAFADRLALMMFSIVEGDKPTAFQAFLGLANEAAHDEAKRKALEAEILCAGIMDLPGPRLLTGTGVNSAHKAIRARALVDLANALGWEQAYSIFYVVVPDIANNPRYHDLFEAAHVVLSGAFGAGYHGLRQTNTGLMNEREAEEFIAVMLYGSPDEVQESVTGLLQAGKSLVAINDCAVLAAARLMARLENPSLRAGFSNTAHCFDYANVVGFWLRQYDHPQQVKAVYYTPQFVNDTSRFIRFRAPKNPDAAFTSQPSEHAAHADGLTLTEALVELAQACDAQNAPLATALADSYMRRTPERQALIDALIFENAKFEGDPHMPRNAMSHHEEYLHSTLPKAMRDDIFRSWVRFVSRWQKRSYEFNCFGLYERLLVR